VRSTDTFRLFVYGTLRRDGRRHRHLAGQAFLGVTRTRPLYALLDLGAYPGLIRCEDEGQAVEGELYEVSRELLARLDDIEGAPDLFRLGPVEVEGVAGPVHAYFYQRAAAGRPRCATGRWDNRRGRAAEDV
jgi:gamma-glutamylcyclotransferase (GGCT)/AIG2-like uncharacterized protein YtfP